MGWICNMITQDEIISFVGDKGKIIKGDSKPMPIYNFMSLAKAIKGSITFSKNKVAKTDASITFGPIGSTIDTDGTVIEVENPRLWFIKITNKYFFPKYESSIPSFVMSSSTIANNAIIGKNVKIGKNTIIGSNVTILDNTIIGSNVIIHSGAVIGTDGFGYEVDDDNTIHKFIHSGKVIIHDDVEIGANTCIDRGTFGDTIIGKGTKIDNLVNISHNVHLGKNCLIITNTVVAGSCKIGNNTRIAMSATIREGAIIGNNVVIGMGAVVTKNIPSNKTAYGNPAKIQT